ncbi:MAG TPA: serine hydrolase domain-containing protein [Saprospiraceae bacterium]|nr:serine hydrolase domain-containing protein [Saprospiraceae bacterium]
MKFFFRLILFPALIAVPLIPAFSQAENLRKEIEEIITYEAGIDFSVVPGVMVGVMDGDSMYISSHGEPMDKRGIFELGSVTKPFVAWLADQALDSLGWTREVSACRFLPDSICNPKWESVTVGQLLSHRAGLPRLPDNLGTIGASATDPYAPYSINRLAADIKLMTPQPGVYSYSNLGYAVLYWLFEKVGGMEAFTGEKLLVPLQLKHTGWEIPDSQIMEGHGLDGRVRPPWHCNALSPALGLKADMPDILTWMEYISPGLAPETPVLDAALKKQLKALNKSETFMVMDGWFLIESSSALVYYHTGRTGGHHVSIAFIPGARKGVVVISNGSLGSMELSLLVLDMVARSKTK